MNIPPHSADAKRATAFANLKEGVAYVWSTPAVLALMMLAYVPRVFAVPYQTLMPVFQKDVLHVGPEGLGLLMAAPGIGAVIAVLTLASLGHRIKRQGLLLVGSIVILGFFLIVFSQLTSLPLALITLVIAGAFPNVFSCQYRHDAAACRPRRIARPGDEPIHARPRLHAGRRRYLPAPRRVSSARP